MRNTRGHLSDSASRPRPPPPAALAGVSQARSFHCCPHPSLSDSGVTKDQNFLERSALGGKAEESLRSLQHSMVHRMPSSAVSLCPHTSLLGTTYPVLWIRRPGFSKRKTLPEASQHVNSKAQLLSLVPRRPLLLPLCTVTFSRAI